MKVYNEITIDMNPESSSYKDVLSEDSFDYEGPMAKLASDDDGGWYPGKYIEQGFEWFQDTIIDPIVDWATGDGDDEEPYIMQEEGVPTAGRMSYAEMQQFVDPNTGAVTDLDAFAAWLNKVNPQLAGKLGATGDIDYMRLSSFIESMPSLTPPASALREHKAEYKSAMDVSHHKTMLEGLKLQSKEGLSGVYGVNRDIADIGKGTKAQIAGYTQDKGNLFGLGTDIEKGVVDYMGEVYGDISQAEARSYADSQDDDDDESWLDRGLFGFGGPSKFF